MFSLASLTVAGFDFGCNCFFLGVFSLVFPLPFVYSYSCWTLIFFLFFWYESSRKFVSLLSHFVCLSFVELNLAILKIEFLNSDFCLNLRMSCERMILF